ncbi:MAG: phosphopyruvate hydratase [Legionellales bacterium]|nr:phosphopyruvate hydratase [Legionellales bacterium]
MFKVNNIESHQVFDSRGFPTIATEVTLSCGSKGYSMVPSGASTGQFEAFELRDNDPVEFFGKGVKKALIQIKSEISKSVIDKTFKTQADFDHALRASDSCQQFKNVGANSVLSLSKAFAKATAYASKIELFQKITFSKAFHLPVPLLNVINGGAHANNNLSIQEFMIVPHGFNYFSDAMRAGCEIYQYLKHTLKQKGYSTSVGDEGGFAPNFDSDEKVIDLLLHAIQSCGYQPGSQVSIALDVAASEFYDSNKYKTQTGSFETKKWVDYLVNLTKKYPISSIEDPCADIDEKGWKYILKEVPNSCKIVGDDLIVTQLPRLKHSFENKLANAILIKPNQVGTITDTLDAIRFAKEKDFKVIVSHRSGDTEDTFIADLAVATQAHCIKAGAPCRSERLAKYNRLLWLEEKFDLELYRDEV